MINESKPTPSIGNVSRPAEGVTWANWDVAWKDETRTWRELLENMQNDQRPGLGFLLTESGGYLFQENYDKILLTNTSGITNQLKP